MNKIRQISLAVPLAIATGALTACDPPKRAPERVDYTHSDVACVRETALAIAASGRPYPNILRTKDSAILERDVWIGRNLFRIAKSQHPGYSIHNPGFLPDEHPLSGNSLIGSVEQTLGIPRQTFAHPSVGGTILGGFQCTSDYRNAQLQNLTAPSREELIVKVLAQMRSTSKRPDLIQRFEMPAEGMTAIGTVVDGSLNGTEGAYYLPKKQTMTSVSESGQVLVQGFNCVGAYDPRAPLELRNICEASVLIDSATFLSFRVYQQFMPFVPRLHTVLRNQLQNSKQK